MNFIKEYGSIIITIFVLLFIIAIIILIRYLAIKWWQKIERINNLKNWKTPFKEVIWKVKSIEYMMGSAGLSFKYLAKWYFLVEWENPLTNELKIYKSQIYTYTWTSHDKLSIVIQDIPAYEDKESLNQYISKYLKVGDKIKITVSLENPNDYIVEDIINRKNS